MSIDLKDYVEVPERIKEFARKHPEGSLQSEVLAYPTPEYPFIVVKALAYRTPDDPRPGVGHAAELFPGRTPYTKDSELMNAETSAWGRALVAVLAADTKRGIASANEIAGRQSSPQASSTMGKGGAAPKESKAGGGEGAAASKSPSSQQSPPADSSPDYIEGVDDPAGEPERPRLMKKFHALGKELGKDHAGTKDLLGITQSLEQLTDAQLIGYIGMLDRAVQRAKVPA